MRSLCVLFVTFKETEVLRLKTKPSSTLWRGSLRGERLEDVNSASLHGWVPSNIYLLSCALWYVLIFPWCFYNQKISGTLFMCRCRLPCSSHWERCPVIRSHSENWLRVKRGLQTLCTPAACAGPPDSPFLGGQGITGLGGPTV